MHLAFGVITIYGDAAVLFVLPIFCHSVVIIQNVD